MSRRRLSVNSHRDEWASSAALLHDYAPNDRLVSVRDMGYTSSDDNDDDDDNSNNHHNTNHYHHDLSYLDETDVYTPTGHLYEPHPHSQSLGESYERSVPATAHRQGPATGTSAVTDIAAQGSVTGHVHFDPEEQYVVDPNGDVELDASSSLSESVGVSELEDNTPITKTTTTIGVDMDMNGSKHSQPAAAAAAAAGFADDEKQGVVVHPPNVVVPMPMPSNSSPLNIPITTSVSTFNDSDRVPTAQRDDRHDGRRRRQRRATEPVVSHSLPHQRDFDQYDADEADEDTHGTSFISSGAGYGATSSTNRRHRRANITASSRAASGSVAYENESSGSSKRRHSGRGGGMFSSMAKPLLRLDTDGDFHTPLLGKGRNMKVRKSFNMHAVHFSQWKNAAPLVLPSRLIQNVAARLLLPLYLPFLIYYHYYPTISAPALSSESMLRIFANAFMYILSLLPAVLHQTEYLPRELYTDHVVSVGEVYAPIFMLVISSLIFSTWDTTGAEPDPITQTIFGSCACLGTAGDIVCDNAQQKLDLMTSSIGDGALKRRHQLRRFRFAAAPVPILAIESDQNHPSSTRTIEYARQTETGKFTADVVADQIMASAGLAAPSRFMHGFAFVLCLTASLLLALIPTFLRSSHGVLGRMYTETIVVAVCYFICAFVFTNVHGYYFMRAVEVFGERRRLMRAITAMGMLTDHELKADRRHNIRLFPVLLPRLDFSIPSHLQAWSKLRVYLQNIQVTKLRKYNMHLSILFFPILALGLAVLIEYMFFPSTTHKLETGSYIVLFALIILGTMMFITMLTAASVNALEASHVQSLNRARYRISELITRSVAYKLQVMHGTNESLSATPHDALHLGSRSPGDMSPRDHDDSTYIGGVYQAHGAHSPTAVSTPTTIDPAHPQPLGHHTPAESTLFLLPHAHHHSPRSQASNARYQYRKRQVAMVEDELLSMRQSYRMIGDLGELIGSIGASGKLLGTRMDYSFIFKLVGFLFWALATQFLRILFTR
jgi:hypothetical protein